MEEPPADILLLTARIAPAELKRLVGAYFEDMVMEIQDPAIRERLRALSVSLLGAGEPLP